MDIKMKTAIATVTDTSANAEEFPGTFEVELSNETTDRDGDTLLAQDWETPLPERITFVNDHTHKMANVVGSAVPELTADGRLLCKGEWAPDPESQATRAKIKHVPYTSVAYAEKSNGKRELINGAFVVVPSNPTARVLASKSYAGEGLDNETQALIQDIVKETLKTAGVAYVDKSLSDDLASMGLKIVLDKPDSTVTIKHGDKVLATHKLPENTNEAPAKAADPVADSTGEDAAALLARTKAAALQIVNEQR